MRLVLIIWTLIVLFSCKEYSNEDVVNPGFDTTLIGNGNNSYFLKMPLRYVGKLATINFFVTLYSEKEDSIGRNDFIYQLPMNRMIKKYSGNPVYEDTLTIHGMIIIPDTLQYYTTSYYVGNNTPNPKMMDTIKITIH